MIAEVIIYINFYIIGVVLGSFFTLAIYRIPLKQDIMHTRSYCPNCKAKLKFLDLIPILSYTFLKGKCRYCHEKISPRYIVIETFSGLLYLLFVVSLKIDFLKITLTNIVQLLYGTLIISTFFILGGIAKEKKTLSIETLCFGVAVSLAHIIYLYILNVNVYRYIIYIVVIIILLILQKNMKNKSKREIIYILITLIFGLLVTSEVIFISSTVATLLLYFIMRIFAKLESSNIIFYFSFLNILFLILYNFLIL